MKRIVQIELCNHCNRRCSYCGQPTMKRERGFMSVLTLLKVIDWLKLLNQTSVGLNHYGESLMHPEFINFLDILNQNGIIDGVRARDGIIREGYEGVLRTPPGMKPL